MKSKTPFYDFPPVTAKEWKQQIQVGLKGKDYNDLLVWDSPDQLKVKPFYHAEDLQGLAERHIKSPDGWIIGQIIDAKDAKTAREKALEALEKGAESLYFKVEEEFDLKDLLTDKELSTVPLHFEIPFISHSFTEQYNSVIRTGKGPLFLHWDVIGQLARTGNWHHSMKQDLEMGVGLIRGQFGIHPFSVDGTLYQNAGATRVQQLAYTLAHACEYMHLLASEGKEKSFRQPVFRMAVDSNYFFEIAKLRAMRLLWASLAREFGAPEDCHIIARPTRRNKTLYEYNANMLRTTMECMAAVNGGADTVLNLPYDALYHKENPFGDRIARNQLLILKEEAYLGSVSNPADGAYYIETLTSQLAKKALAVFKSIEASGGFLSALKKHVIQKKIREQAAKEQESFDQNELVLVGTNAYSNPEDRMKGELEVTPFAQKRAEKTLLEPILEKRLAENMEKKRLEHE
ncbi:heterodimeric methylmalonyl-CoA mutase small subunit [Muriicola jejuensis]|uniref:Methylmalonyl-CoA mutase n=1 Tax=Muriicola jejuensis TaxID=504488 RepID=A0A6P0UC49_9FLAO|nr:methylmalonyl-CoA mutase subunit beta [Muriicola jejuensis]NER10835.1 methylmalonyl-CoA mutase [Muriicola jejuensis]SMP16094.1 heterodimeric methylmalonyl-CoA mutase small subunit [Muriicola jejuensis]